MGFSLAGLASTMQGYQQGARQFDENQMIERKNQSDQRQREQETKAQAENDRFEAAMKGDEAGLKSAGKRQTNGQAFMEKVSGLFKPSGKLADVASTAPAADQSGAQPATQQPVQPGVPGMATTITPQQSGAGIGATPAATAQPNAGGEQAVQGATSAQGAATPAQSQQPAQVTQTIKPYSQRIDGMAEDYLKKNPNDMSVYFRMKNKATEYRKAEEDQRVQATQAAHTKALDGYNRTGKVKYLEDHFNDGIPNGDRIKIVKGDDGGYRIIDEKTGEETVNLNELYKSQGLSGRDALVAHYGHLYNPRTLMDVHNKAEATALEANAKLYSENEKDRNQTANKKQLADDTGVTAGNAAAVTAHQATADSARATAEATRLATSQKRALDDLNKQIAEESDQNSSNYKALVAKRAAFLPQTKPQDPKVVAPGGAIFDPATKTWQTKREYDARIAANQGGANPSPQGQKPFDPAAFAKR